VRKRRFGVLGVEGPAREAAAGPPPLECLPLPTAALDFHDDAFNVRTLNLEVWAKADPIERFRTWLRENAELTDEEEDEIASEVKKTLNDALKRAEESPLPDASKLTEGVYATPEDLDTPHHK
jgi:TPP-dependent pyruvate/acetoin dehydrogenase alpha subunit